MIKQVDNAPCRCLQKVKNILCLCITTVYNIFLIVLHLEIKVTAGSCTPGKTDITNIKCYMPVWHLMKGLITFKCSLSSIQDGPSISWCSLLFPADDLTLIGMLWVHSLQFSSKSLLWTPACAQSLCQGAGRGEHHPSLF